MWLLELVKHSNYWENKDIGSWNMSLKEMNENVQWTLHWDRDELIVLPARFAEILQNYVARLVFRENVLDSFYCFYIEVAYSNFTFCGACRLSLLVCNTISAKRVHSRIPTDITDSSMSVWSILFQKLHPRRSYMTTDGPLCKRQSIMVGIDCCFVGIYNDCNITINALDHPSQVQSPILVVSLASIWRNGSDKRVMKKN